MASGELDRLTKRLIEFRDARDWRQYHTIKDLIVSLNLEAAELMELTQWQSCEAFEHSLKDGDQFTELKHECADVLNYLLLIAERAGFDLADAAHDKIDVNEKKYPIEKSRGNAKKYTKL